MNDIKIDVNSIISLHRINNQLLSMIDCLKDRDDISIKSLMDNIYEPYEKIDINYRKSHQFFNQYQLISSLYTYIVLPKEHFFDYLPDDLETNNLVEKWGLKNLSNYKFKYFLRRMRNSISHGNINFTENLQFIFLDINPRNSDDIFEATLSGDDIIKFTQALAYWCLTKDLDLEEL